MYYFAPILVQLTFSSANASLVHSIDKFCVALNDADFCDLGHTMTWAVLLMGEVILLHFAACLLETLSQAMRSALR